MLLIFKDSISFFSALGNVRKRIFFVVTFAINNMRRIVIIISIEVDF